MTPNNKHHKYLLILLRAFQNGNFKPAPGSVNHVHVYHDDTCSIHTGGVCDCNPEVIHEVKKNDR